MNAFLDRISGLFDKGLILAALFPLLIFACAVLAIAIPILGAAEMLDWLETLAASSSLSLGAALTIVLLSSSFILRSLRRPLLAAWSGGLTPPWFLACERNRRDHMDRDIAAAGIWRGAEQRIVPMPAEPRGVHQVPVANRTALETAVAELLRDAATPQEQQLRSRFDGICANLESLYLRYHDNALRQVRRDLVNLVRPREQAERITRQTLQAEQLLAFGPRTTVKATRLGNCLDALDNYSYERYWMEGGVFWPHLEHLMKEDLRDDIENQRILLDFLLALASLSVVVALLAMFVGPWLWLSWLWPGVIVVSGVVSYLMYRLSIPAAYALGSALRAGCDLYRQDLLLALGLEVPGTLAEERELWQQVSQLVIYGAPQGMVMAFRHREPADNGNA
jgi:hypothetical protein